MNDPLPMSMLNDFIFCPASIYFHNMYQELNGMIYKDKPQIAGTHSHKTIDSASYSSQKNILQGTTVYCGEYGLIGKIDKFDISKGELVESKKKINKIFDGYIFQLYAQCFALREMGYQVLKIALYSMDDNKRYPINLPETDPVMQKKFKDLILQIFDFSLSDFKQDNLEKCKNCIYSYACKWGNDD